MVAVPEAKRTVAIDFLYLDLEVCGRCRGTDANLGAALDAVQEVLEGAGADVRVTKTLVDTEERARALQFVSSPTGCCDARQQESCCAPSQKSSCCGPTREANAGACGCQ